MDLSTELGEPIDSKMCKSWIWVQEIDWTCFPDNSRAWSKFETEKCTNLLSSRIRFCPARGESQVARIEIKFWDLLFSCCVPVIKKEESPGSQSKYFPASALCLSLAVYSWLPTTSHLLKKKTKQMISSYWGPYHSMFHYLIFSQNIFRLPQGSLCFFSSFENPFL